MRNEELTPARGFVVDKAESSMLVSNSTICLVWVLIYHPHLPPAAPGVHPRLRRELSAGLIRNNSAGMYPSHPPPPSSSPFSPAAAPGLIGRCVTSAAGAGRQLSHCIQLQHL
jgi:hypothetical protein